MFIVVRNTAPFQKRNKVPTQKLTSKVPGIRTRGPSAIHKHKIQ